MYNKDLKMLVCVYNGSVTTYFLISFFKENIVLLFFMLFGAAFQTLAESLMNVDSSFWVLPVSIRDFCRLERKRLSQIGSSFVCH